MERIIVRVPNWVGDAVLSTPALSILRQERPLSRISVLARRGVCECFMHNPDVDEITPLSARKGFPYWKKAFDLRKKGYNAGILFPNSFSSAFLFRLSWLPVIRGYRTDGRSFFLTDGVQFDGKSAHIHQVEYYCRLIRKDIAPSGLVWCVTPGEREEAKEILDKNGLSPEAFLVAIAPGASFGSAKRWPAEYFASLSEKLARKYSAKILILGSKDEMGVSELICSNLKGKALNLAGETNLRQLGSLLTFCKFLISNDSGAMHIAVAVGTPVVAIFGSTDPKKTGPWQGTNRVLYRGLSCSPCFQKKCPPGHYRCLKEITVDDVFHACTEACLK